MRVVLVGTLDLISRITVQSSVRHVPRDSVEVVTYSAPSGPPPRRLHRSLEHWHDAEH